MGLMIKKSNIPINQEPKIQTKSLYQYLENYYPHNPVLTMEDMETIFKTVYLFETTIKD